MRFTLISTITHNDMS